MYRAELRAVGCSAVVDEELSHREAAWRCGIDRRTVAGALLTEEIPYSFEEARSSPNLGGVTTPSVHTAAWIADSRSGSDRANPARLGCTPPSSPLGGETVNAPTMELDQSPEAGQDRRMKGIQATEAAPDGKTSARIHLHLIVQ